MKEDELRQRTECANCHKKIGHTGLPLFWTLKIERHGIDIEAVKRQDGLTALLGGNAFLAHAMGTDAEMTKPMMDPVEITLCEECAMGDVNIAALALGD
jgi:hypothetical protein